MGVTKSQVVKFTIKTQVESKEHQLVFDFVVSPRPSSESGEDRSTGISKKETVDKNVFFVGARDGKQILQLLRLVVEILVIYQGVHIVQVVGLWDF